MEKLLTRGEFRDAVFERDEHVCVICTQEAQDAHHILERRLFPDGGYYLSNGSSLCGDCHLDAEKTILSVEDIRKAIGITKPVIPPHLYSDVIYTKWGDTILANGTRTPGELFHDESVQKVLAPVLHLYTQYVKYPRTYHFPWSGYIGEDDRITTDLSMFDDEIVMTEKMDGENTTLYNDHIHARSLDAQSHWTQSWVRQFHSRISYEIPKSWRFCGENLFAQHSIAYKELESYFYLFSIWNDKNICLSWQDTEDYANILDIPLVPVIFKGKWTDKPEKIHKLWTDNYSEKEHEGYVIRSAKEFPYASFRKSTGKYVRTNHVTTSTHWKFEKIEQNKLK